jgi:hypothetical protein
LTHTCWFSSNFFNRPTFRSANLTAACFQDADLEDVDFRTTNLQGAAFCGADLRGANFLGSNLTAEQLACEGITVNCGTILPNGKRAVPCAKGETCCNVCTDINTGSHELRQVRAYLPGLPRVFGRECVCGSTGQPCGSGLTCCNGQCVNTQSDPDNCGQCENQCHLPETCVFGDCIVP